MLGGAMLRRAANLASAITASGAILAALLWGASRLIGDPNVATQFVLWMPTWAFIGAILALGGVSWCAAMLGRRPASDPAAYADPALRRPGFGAWRRVACALAAALGLYLLLAEWRMGNAIAGPEQAPRERTLRVLNWNPTSTFMDAFPLVLEPIDADVAFIANPPAIVDWTRVRDQFDPARDAVRFARFAVISRHPVLRWGWADLKVRGSEPVLQSTHKASWLTIDTGQALWVEVDASATLGRPIVVWFIDMPSNPRIARAKAFEVAARSLREWNGNAMERSSIDAEAPMSAEAYAARFGLTDPDGPGPMGAGFPPPDVIIGDFNTPRGGRSIQRLVGPDTRSAFAQAGYGPMGTWPRQWGLLAIDQAYTATWLRATRYDVLDPGVGEHRAQVIEITTR